MLESTAGAKPIQSSQYRNRDYQCWSKERSVIASNLKKVQSINPLIPASPISGIERPLREAHSNDAGVNNLNYYDKRKFIITLF